MPHSVAVDIEDYTEPPMNIRKETYSTYERLFWSSVRGRRGSFSEKRGTDSRDRATGP